MAAPTAIRHAELVSASMVGVIPPRLRQSIFRTKPQSHKEEGLGRQTLLLADGAAGRTMAEESHSAVGATSSWLCGFVRNKKKRGAESNGRPWTLKQVRGDRNINVAHGSPPIIVAPDLIRGDDFSAAMEPGSSPG